MKKKNLYISFSEIKQGDICNSIIVLDVDGTLVADGLLLVDEKTRNTIKELGKNNIIFLCSNKSVPVRNQEIAKSLDLPIISDTYRKPNSVIKQVILDQLQDSDKNKPFVVIGDKWMTDGRFAQNISARFIPVRRIVSKTDTLLIRLSYLVDDVYAYCTNC